MLCPLGLGSVWGLLVHPGPCHPISRVPLGSWLAQSSTAVPMVLAGVPKFHSCEVLLMLRSVVQSLPFCTLVASDQFLAPHVLTAPTQGFLAPVRPEVFARL